MSLRNKELGWFSLGQTLNMTRLFRDHITLNVKTKYSEWATKSREAAKQSKFQVSEEMFLLFWDPVGNRKQP